MVPLFSQVMNLNVNRVFTLTQKLVPLLRKGAERDGVGRVINVSMMNVTHPSILSYASPQIGSVQGIDAPRLETYAYSTSKAALAQ
jgi:NAD(P)-dependent dehydrogenase (short-subunit alcohol dehydrogenase family)